MGGKASDGDSESMFQGTCLGSGRGAAAVARCEGLVSRKPFFVIFLTCVRNLSEPKIWLSGVLCIMKSCFFVSVLEANCS